MKNVGIALMVFGLAWAIMALNMDTSVRTGLGIDRVHNIGLMEKRQTQVIASLGTAIVGVLLFGFGSTNQRQKEATVLDSEPAKEDTDRTDSSELMSAIASGDLEEVKRIFAAGFKISDYQGQVNPVEYAELFGYPEIAAFLKENGAPSPGSKEEK